jgi:hypothetical protein
MAMTTRSEDATHLYSFSQLETAASVAAYLAPLVSAGMAWPLAVAWAAGWEGDTAHALMVGSLHPRVVAGALRACVNSEPDADTEDVCSRAHERLLSMGRNYHVPVRAACAAGVPL